MHDPADDLFLIDNPDAPEEFEGQNDSALPPVGMTWWEGRWPTGGVNGLDDLKWWVEMRLEEMMSLRRDEDLSEIGRLLGIQALANADRYLGRLGKGDHPTWPEEDKLKRVEDVEDALESVLRYLRQQGQPTGTGVPQAAPPMIAGKHPPLKSWRQPALDAAIHEYIARRAAALKSLTEAVQANRKGAVEMARKTFGRSVLARALGVKAKAMITKSPAWIEIADELRLRPSRDGLRGLNRSDKIGFDKAVEDKSDAEGDPVADEVEEREAIENIDGEVTEQAAVAYVRKHLTGTEAEAIIASIRQGETPPERVVKLVKTLLTRRDDTRRRRPR